MHSCALELEDTTKAVVGDAGQAVVQLHVISPVLAAVVVRHLTVVVLLLQQLLLFIGEAQHTLLFDFT